MNYEYRTRKKLMDDYVARWEKANAGALRRVDQKVYEHAVQLATHRDDWDAVFVEMVRKDCASGIYRAPSDFMKRHMEGMIRAFVPAESLEEYYAMVDELTTFQYTTGFTRRSLRTADFTVHVCHAVRLMYAYMAFGVYGVSMADYLRDALSEEMLDFKNNFEGSYGASEFLCVDELIAARINAGDPGVIDAIRDAILSENNTVIVTRNMITAIVKSKNQELHELLGKFLVAARLQEGVRQAICESMDQGRLDSFVTLLKVIDRENLVRFAAVKRAFAVWTGFLDETNIDRLIAKAMPIMLTSIEDGAYARELLKTDDSMKIMLGLWALAAHEVQDAIAEMRVIAENGTRVQKLTLSLFAPMLQNQPVAGGIAAYVVEHNPDDTELIGAWMDTYIGNVSSLVYSAARPKEKTNQWKPSEDREYDYYEIEPERVFPDDWWNAGKVNNAGNLNFIGKLTGSGNLNAAGKANAAGGSDGTRTSKASRARIHYEILKDNYARIEKNTREIRPFVFPWLTLTIRKSAFVERMSVIAYALKDQDLIDEMCQKLDEIDCTYLYSSARMNHLRMLLYAPATEIQRQVLVNAVCNKESGTRETAYALLKRIPLRREEYERLVGFLKYKNEETRKYVLELLKQQSRPDLAADIRTLLASKNANMRLAGFDLLKTEYEDDRERAKKILAEAGIGGAEAGDSVTGAGTGDSRTKAGAGNSLTEQEKILYNAICGETTEERTKENGYGLYDPGVKMEIPPVKSADGASFISNIVKSLAGASFAGDSAKKTSFRGAQLVRDYFSVTKAELDQAFIAVNDLFVANGHLEYKCTNGDTYLLANGLYLQNGASWSEPMRDRYPFKELWTKCYEEHIHSEKLLLAMKLALHPGYDERSVEDLQGYRKREKELLGSVLSGYQLPELNLGEGARYISKDLNTIIEIMEDITGARIPREVAIAACEYMAEIPEKDRWYIEPERKSSYIKERREYHAFTDAQNMHMFVSRLLAVDCMADYEEVFWALRRLDVTYAYLKRADSDYGWRTKRNILSVRDFIAACAKGIITKDHLYQYIFEEYPLVTAVSELGLFSGVPLSLSAIRTLGEYMEVDREKKTFDKSDPFYKLGNEVYTAVADLILNVELKRGDTETEFSKAAGKLNCVWGLDRLGEILHSLGKNTLDRSAYYYNVGTGKKACLSHLLHVCRPLPGDRSEDFANIKVSEDRLIEVAMYAPQWVDLIGEYLHCEGLRSGCYYFMAHMDERFDDKKKAIIAKYTPLTFDELNDGAFDLNWFRESYQALGEEMFLKLYAAAKYISDGAKHTRARKYADAALGKVDRDELEIAIADKRNKDLLMSYGIIPIVDEKDSLHRYEFIRKFLKESRQFGAQRRASEGKACEMALKNLATASGYADSLRLTLAMETALIKENEAYFEGTMIDDYKVQVTVAEDGKAELILEKGGKRLKAVPAALKKNETFVAMKEFVTKLKDQYSRTVKMFENAMEEQEEYTVEELTKLCKNPVLKAILTKLIYVKDGEFYRIGEDGQFVAALEEDEEKNSEAAVQEDEEKNSEAAVQEADKELSGVGLQEDNKELSGVGLQEDTADHAAMARLEAREQNDAGTSQPGAKDAIRVAHPYDMYIYGKWSALQELVFTWVCNGKKYQPFKQVFRELYLKLPEEADSISSRMFAGNQIQPKKTVATLKNRKWIADYENGLQKIFYKDNVIATIYAMADWFSPSDIEEPTLEYVAFYDRKSFEGKKISEIPDILYSEVLRDVDLAVSVAHAGGVDPETSHSTIELRKTIIEFNIKLFKLKNVRLEGTHAFVTGKYGEYSVHLGSGVVHKLPGIAINILPVHSQSRGKIFLPFIDEDPKTAEIMSKIVMLAQDNKIKDPAIMEQIMRG